MLRSESPQELPQLLHHTVPADVPQPVLTQDSGDSLCHYPKALRTLGRVYLDTSPAAPAITQGAASSPVASPLPALPPRQMVPPALRDVRLPVRSVSAAVPSAAMTLRAACASTPPRRLVPCPPKALPHRLAPHKQHRRCHPLVLSPPLECRSSALVPTAGMLLRRAAIIYRRNGTQKGFALLGGDSGT